MSKPEPIGKSALAVLFLAAALVASCSFDYGEDSGERAPELPSATFIEFSHSVYSNGVRILDLKAARAETYEKEGKTVLHGVDFSEYDRNTGAVAASGRAAAAVFWTATENAEFSGNIRINAIRDNATLSSEFLAWDGQQKLLTSGLDRTVEIHRGDGSWARGAGFSADSRRRSFSFREAAEGILVAPVKAPPAEPLPAATEKDAEPSEVRP